MEALWKLEDKWKLSTQEAILLLGCTALALVGLGLAAALKKARTKQLDTQEPSRDDDDDDDTLHTKWPEPSRGWLAIKRMLLESVRWSRARKWEERKVSKWGDRPSPLLGLEGYKGDRVGRQSHSSDSPVWQRPILMGEKCELPRFSGLILYDERGQLLSEAYKQISCGGTTPQEKRAPAARTSLRDLL